MAIMVGGRRKTFYSLVIEFLDLRGSVYKSTKNISKQPDFVREEGFSARRIHVIGPLFNIFICYYQLAAGIA